jgi:hypothetical protein
LHGSGRRESCGNWHTTGWQLRASNEKRTHH